METGWVSATIAHTQQRHELGPFSRQIYTPAGQVTLSLRELIDIAFLVVFRHHSSAIHRQFGTSVSCLHVAQDLHSAQQPGFPRNRSVHFRWVVKFCKHMYETKSPVKELVTYTRPDRANFIQCQTAQFGNTSWRPPQLLI